MRQFLLPVLLTVAPVCLAQSQSQSKSQALPDAPVEVTVTATRVPLTADRIAAGVTVIDRSVIEAQGYTTVTEALSAVPGLRIVQSGGPGGNASVFIRGTNSNHVLVLRDGMQVNDPSDPGNAFNFGVDTLNDIERIEVVRGPMSGVYGSGAIGGVINIVTRRGEGTAHAELELAAGLPRAALGRAAISGQSGVWDYSATAEGRTDRGSDITPRRESSYTGERDGYRTRAATVNLGLTPVEGTRFSVLLRGRQSAFGYDNVGGFPGTDNRLYAGRDDNVYGRAGVTSRLFGGVWETSLFLGRNQTDRRFVNAFDPAANQSGDSRYHGRRTDAQWNNTVRLPNTAWATQAALTFGYQHINDSIRVRADSVFSGFAFNQAARAHADSDAGYVGLQAVLLQRLTLTGNVRGEATTLTQNSTTYRFGGVFAVPEVLTKIKASYGTAFRAPSLFDQYGVDTSGYIGNPALRPETSRGFEAGLVTELPVFGVRDGVMLSGTYFNNRIKNLIQAQFGVVSTALNIANATTHGAEAVLTLHPVPWADADLTYTYTDARDGTTGARLLRRPLHAASGTLRLRPIPGLTIAPELIYTGAFQDFLVDDNGFGQGVGRARSGLLANLNVTYVITQQLNVFAYAKNIGGSRFEPASGYATPGQSFLTGTRLKF